MAHIKGFRKAYRRFLWLYISMVVVYSAVLASALYMIDAQSPLWLKVSAGLLVAFPLFGALYAMRRVSEETDEYLRMRQLRLLRDAGLLTAGAALLLGFLIVFGALSSFPVVWVGIGYFFACGIAWFLPDPRKVS